MRTGPLIAAFIVFLLCAIDCHGQKNTRNGVPVRDIAFIVRNGDYIKNIAAKINVPAREIVKLNKLGSKNYLAYPGRQLTIPVQVQPKVWDPTKEDMTGYSPSREDRHEGEDFEVMIDSSNYKLDEDFINLTTAREDSLEYENIAAHLQRLEKGIHSLYARIDSMKQMEFKYDGDDQNNNPITNNMKMSRDKYYSAGPIGREIDSLKAVKGWLVQRRIILSNQISEYEYLVDNAGYSERNFKHDDKDKPSNWGDHLAYEAKYMQDKAKAADQAKNPPQPVVKKAAAEEDKVSESDVEPPASSPPSVRKETAHADAPAPVKSPPAKPVPDNTKSLEKNNQDVADSTAAIAAAEAEVMPHYKSDFSVLSKQFITSEIYATHGFHRTLALLRPDEAIPYKLPAELASAAQVAAKETPKRQVADTKETPKPRTADIKEKDKPQAVATPIATSATPAKSTQPQQVQVQETNAEVAKEKPHNEYIAETAPAPVSSLISDEGQPLGLDTRIDTTKAKPEKKINTDPLASYKTDSDFVKKPGQIKNTPVTESKNKNKYLIPVDTATRLKAEVYLTKAREALEKGDFKSGDKFLRKSLDINPNDAQAWMLHADLFLTMGLADQALKEYLISAEIDSLNPKVFYNIALLYSKANNNQKAYKCFSKAIEINAKYLLAYMGRASLQMGEHDYDGAVEDYNKVLTINKYYSPAFKARGLVMMEQHKFSDAIADFDMYLEIEDPDGYVLYQRGISKIYSNNVMQGCIDLSTAEKLGFKDAEDAIKQFCQ